MNQQELFKDNLRDSHWLGEVIDNQDSNKLGRCKVRVFGKFDLLEDIDIPWAIPMFEHGQYMIPKIGDIVAVRFDNGNIYTPVYKYNVNLTNGVKTELESLTDQTDLITLAYDEEKDIKVYWKNGEGIIIQQGQNDLEPAVLGDKNAKVLQDINSALQKIVEELTKIGVQTTALAVAGGAAAAVPIFSAAPLAPAFVSLNSTVLTAITNITTEVAKIQPGIEPTKSPNIKIN